MLDDLGIAFIKDGFLGSIGAFSMFVLLTGVHDEPHNRNAGSLGCSTLAYTQYSDLKEAAT